MPEVSPLKPAEAQSSAAAEPHSAALTQPIKFAMLSHPGRVRRANEDACGALPEQGAFVVCDGMGGAAAGEVASRLALDTFLGALHEFRGLPETSTPPRQPAGQPQPRLQLEEAVRAANHAVFKHSQKSRALRGMGTTLVAVLVDDTARTLWLAHVGDSRCYRLRDGALEQLTQDHSLVEEQIQAGLLSRVEAESSPIRNIITRAIGSQATVEPEISAHPTHPGELYLLASDGLTRELADAEIADLLTSAPSLEAACQTLVEHANARGGHDNITLLLIAILG